ncbi:MAG: hypothetical protein QG642_184 [Patescibacteria group bacterium]|nr:hypothetical protein [Patescibacteria group bacterium]
MKNPFEGLYKKTEPENQTESATGQNKIEYGALPETVKSELGRLTVGYKKHDDLGVFGVNHVTAMPLENGDIQYQIDGTIGMKLADRDKYGKERFSTRPKTFTITTHVNGDITGVENN